MLHSSNIKVKVGYITSTILSVGTPRNTLILLNVGISSRTFRKTDSFQRLSGDRITVRIVSGEEFRLRSENILHNPGQDTSMQEDSNYFVLPEVQGSGLGTT